MFSHISWGQYFETILYALPLYYAYVVVVYYRTELKGLVSGKGLSACYTGSRPHQPSEHSSEALSVPEKEGHYSLLINSLKDELTAFLLSAGQNEFTKEDTLLSLQHLLQKYPSVNGSPYQADIEQMIMLQCERECSIQLSESEVTYLWRN